MEISNVGSFGTMRLAINQMVSGGMTTEDATVMALQCKFETNKELKILLANTGLRNITTQNKEQVDLMFIKILNKMRYNYILEDSM